MTNYVSLHNHTTFSIMDSLIKPSELFKKVKELGQPAVAVTDHASIAAAWDCLKYSKEAGVKLIIGCEFYFVNDVANEEERLRHVILLAKNEIGYRNLLLISKEGYDNAITPHKKVYSRIDWKALEKYKEGLICTTACSSGIIGQLINSRKLDEAKAQSKRLKDIFGDDLALELQPHAMKRTANSYVDYIDQTYTNMKLKQIGEEFDIKCIAATNAHYINKEEHDAHDVLLAIGAGQPQVSGNRIAYSVPEFYLKSGEEVEAFFTRHFNAEFAKTLCDNTIYFANKCEEPDWIDPKYSNPSGKELPRFPVKDQEDYKEFRLWCKENDIGLLAEGKVISTSKTGKSLEDDVAYLRYRCEKGLKEKGLTENKVKLIEYRDRVKEELEVLEYRGFSSYMLMAADILEYARKKKVRLGPGRGSGSGSLIGYLLDIHVIDSIKYGLLFARFHNKEKTAYPDLDLDFSSREEVDLYVRKKYGEECVAQVSNILAIKPKVYVKDIARTFLFGGSRSEAAKIGQAISDTIPDQCNTYKGAIEASPLFEEYTKRYPELQKYSEHIAGKERDWGMHAGGVIISKRRLPGLVPLRRDRYNKVLLEYEKERAEENGLVKMDFLGLSALSVIDDTYKIIEGLGKIPPPDPIDYEQYDQKTYDLIGRGNTLCVFQLGKSGGTISLCKQIQPKSIDDMAMINTLARPAAQEIRQDFVDTKNGKKAVHIKYKALERALKPTFGFPIYDECLMFVAADVAGWSLDEADRLRKMTKWKGKYPEKVAAWKQDFIRDSIKNGKKEKLAEEVWAMIEKFGTYAFNRSHAIAYSVLGFQTAYLKAHYPLEFLTANLMSQVHSNAPIAKANIIKIKTEIRALNIKIIPPDINVSDITFKAVDNNTLMTGLDALKYVSDKAIPEILSKRPFKDMEDFLTRVDGRIVNSRCIKALAAAGAFDSFGMSRKLMYLYGADYKKKLKAWLGRKIDRRGQKFEYPWPQDVGEFSITEKYALEEEFLGEGFSGTFHDRYPDFLDKKGDKAVTDLSVLSTLLPKPQKKSDLNRQWVSSLKGVVQDLFKFKIKKEDSKLFGRTMAKMTLVDIHNNTVSVTIFPDSLEDLESKVKNLYKKELGMGAAIDICGYINWYNDEVSFTLENLRDYRSSPALPKDMDSRKLKLPRTRKKKTKTTEIDPDEFLEEVEGEMIDEGMVAVDDYDEERTF